MSDERIETLRKVQLFDGLSDKELAAVANAVKERRFDTGDTVVGEGEGGVGFFVIAESPLRVFGLTAWQFTPLLEQHPEIAVKVAKMLARRLRETEERLAAT